jgi:transposase
MFPAARIDLSAIPEEQRDAVAALLRAHGELVGENTALKGETSSLKEIVKRLEHLVAELNHVVHGRKSRS